MKKRLSKALVILIWIGIWQLVAAIINKPYLFASFTDSLKALINLASTARFYEILLHTTLFTFAGFFLALFTGIICGVISFIFDSFRKFLDPVLSVMKSVPVASFVILILVWFGSKPLSIIIAYIVVFPIIYFATLSGLQSTDRQMLEMAEVFRLSRKDRILYIYRLALTPYVLNGCFSAVSMAFKSCIAAEVISASDISIGGQLYYSKIYLDTAALFAWTFVIIILSAVSEKLIIYLLKKIGGRYGDYLK
ncbi:MAG: ABC transporter permease subunit [Erysipelotrichaceae bacterium]|nr:ABC transporter permease subunit [Erysipelotrichaceae bacterium]